MNLMTMQFGSFVFPVNPTELKLERACLLRETVGLTAKNVWRRSASAGRA